MMTTALPKTTLAALAATALFLPFGAPLPGSCLRSVGVAGAAPSPSCGSDLRECLRAAADMHPTTFGVRYVTAEDVARCMETFRSCTSGGARRGGGAVPPTSTSPGGGDKSERGGGGGGGAKADLPQHLGISFEGAVAIDCRISGTTINCTNIPPRPLAQGFESWTGGFTGTLSGKTATGTRTILIEGYVPGEPSCRFTQKGTGTATAVFASDGTVTMREAPFSWQKTFRGSCSGEESNTIPGSEWTAPWSAIG